MDVTIYFPDCLQLSFKNVKRDLTWVIKSPKIDTWPVGMVKTFGGKIVILRLIFAWNCLALTPLTHFVSNFYTVDLQNPYP